MSQHCAHVTGEFGKTSKDMQRLFQFLRRSLSEKVLTSLERELALDGDPHEGFPDEAAPSRHLSGARRRGR